MSQAFTPTQRAELRDAFARSRVAAADEMRRLAAVRHDQRTAHAPTREAKPRKAALLVIEPVRALAPTPPPTSRMEVTLTRNDLSAAERVVFDRLFAACHTEFSTVDVVTHAALVAKSVVAARRRA